MDIKLEENKNKKELLKVNTDSKKNILNQINKLYGNDWTDPLENKKNKNIENLELTIKYFSDKIFKMEEDIKIKNEKINKLNNCLIENGIIFDN